MGLFVLAQLGAMRTAGDDEERARVKLDLLLTLAARKLDEQEMYQWYRYLDWFLPLPRDVDGQVYQEAERQTREKGMPFVTFAERLGLEKGERKGMLKVMR